MTAALPRAATVAEVAQMLRLSPRRIAKLAAEHGLGLQCGNRRRLMPEDVAALVAILKASPCPSKPTAGRPAGIISAARISGSVLTEALALAAQNTRASSRRNAKPKSSKPTPMGQRPSDSSPKLRLVISAAAETEPS